MNKPTMENLSGVEPCFKITQITKNYQNFLSMMQAQPMASVLKVCRTFRLKHSIIHLNRLISHLFTQIGRLEFSISLSMFLSQTNTHTYTHEQTCTWFSAHTHHRDLDRWVPPSHSEGEPRGASVTSWHGNMPSTRWGRVKIAGCSGGVTTACTQVIFLKLFYINLAFY